MSETVERWLEDPLYCPQFDEAYTLAAQRDDRLRPTMLWPDRELIELIVQLVRGSNASGVTSIGAGKGLVEWLVSEYFPPLAVTCVDVDEIRGPAKWNCKCGTIRMSSRPARVPQDDVLMFIFPLNRIPYAEYLKEFRGRCIIIIA